MHTNTSLSKVKNSFGHLPLTVLFLFVPIIVLAQTEKLTGKVTDADGEPLVGVSITAGNSKKAIGTTSVDGRYFISVSPKEQLHFTYLGMKEKVVNVNGKRTINVVLEEDATNIDEVVVSVGYGHVKKRDLTGSVGQASMKEINVAPVSSLEQSLGGRIAGLNIVTADGAPGAEATVTIRGGSLSQDTSPLYIIDGFPIENFNLNTLDPKSIESIEVLKDASSIAIYGTRGANGVIIINTKHAEKGKPQIIYDGSLSLNVRPKFVKMMDAYEYVKLQLELDAMYHGWYSSNTYLGPIDSSTGERPRTLDYYKDVKGTDWQKEVTRSGITNSHSLTMSGGSDVTKYYMKVGYQNQNAIVKNTGQTRYSVIGKLNQKIGKNLNINISTHYTHLDISNNHAFERARKFTPTTGYLNSVEEFIQEMEEMLEVGTLTDNGIDYGNLITPIQQVKNEYDKRFQSNLQAGIQAEWKFLKSFTLSPRFSLSDIDTDRKRFYNSQTYQGHLIKRANGAYANTRGINAYKENDASRSYLLELILSYKQKLRGGHSLDVMSGTSYQYSKLDRDLLTVVNIPQEYEYLGFNSINTGTVYGDHTQYYTYKNRLLSMFGRLNYSFKDRYLFTFTGRYDGSSKFAKGHQWGFFPSGAFAWRFSDEPFMSQIKQINDAKLRVSYGRVGNNKGVSDFSYLTQFESLNNNRSYKLDGNTLTNGIYQYYLANKNLSWEKTTEFDIGLDLFMFNNRISVSFDYYNKIVDDMLMPRSAPFYYGYGTNTRYENVGSTQSKGLELTIMTTNVKTKHFAWNTNFNISYNTNKVRKLDAGYDVLNTVNSAFNQEMWIAQEGKSISEFYGYKFLRLYQPEDFYTTPNGDYQLKPGIPSYTAIAHYIIQPGDPMYADLNGDGVITTADRTTLGSPIPKVIGGLSNTFTYKNFSLDIFFQYSFGGRILDFNQVQYASTGSYSRYTNNYDSYKNRWSPEHMDTDIPRAIRPYAKGDVGSIAYPRVSDRIIYNGDYLRLSTLSLSYVLPKKTLQRLKLQRIELSLSAQNLFVITGYKGQDPEVNSYNENAAPKGIGYSGVSNSTSFTGLTGGVDNEPYPRAKIFNFGVSVTF